jgi:hypothetical protein
VFTRAGGLPERFMLDGRMIMREKLADASFFVPHQIANIEEMGIWCEACEEWTSYGSNAHLGQWFRCVMCGNNWAAEHRNGAVFTRAGGLPQRFMLDGRMIMRENLADVTIIVPHQIATSEEMGIWCEVCEEWTCYGSNAHLGQLFNCVMCGNNWAPEHRIGDVFIRAGALPQRLMLPGKMVMRKKPAVHGDEMAAEGNLQL